ncbi:MAG: endo-1,4-beta-xylanase [Verrucomicrobia bacterium]|nr:endo-1,4-beta-xylanase [Verrucomicrobiota bacterium]MCH8526312.1 endo-1,4-beta-xylanase [Kiritimatiellia bacterium]
MIQVTAMADWRAEADRRIELHRKGSHTLQLLDRDGQPVTQAEVRIEQTGHAFHFGTCVSHTWLERDTPPARQYREFIARHFNTVVGESSMKWAYTERERGTHDFTWADQLLDFAGENNLAVRGHTLFWTKIRYKADWVKELRGEELQEAMENHLRQILPRYQGRLIAWDGINEMITANFFEERIGGHIRPHIYRLAHEIDPGTPLYTNEYSILCNDTGSDAYIKLLREFINGGVPVGGIGIQEHAAERIADVAPEGDQMERLSQFKLTPHGMWTRLDRLAEFNLPIHLTEISFRAEDDEKRAEAVDKFFRVAFAHPAVEAIMLWGFWQRAHWLGRPAALFDEAFNPLPAGEALLNLLENEWKTRETLAPDADGYISFRGFFGPYQVRITDEAGKTSLHTFDLSPENRETVLTH